MISFTVFLTAFFTFASGPGILPSDNFIETGDFSSIRSPLCVMANSVVLPTEISVFNFPSGDRSTNCFCEKAKVVAHMRMNVNRFLMIFF